MAGRRERQREATYAEIISTAQGLLAEGSELSLRAVAQRMGMTAPALYRYVASYQELVDLVAFEIDRAATDSLIAAAERHPADDPSARLIAVAVAFRHWALGNPRAFGLVFANPIADPTCSRGEMLTLATSGHFMNGLLLEVWRHNGLPHPPVEELPAAVQAAVRDPLIPMDTSTLTADERGVLWIFMRAWQALYGVVTLEVFGHMDPRIIESAAMFIQMIDDWMPRLGIDDETGRYRDLVTEELARTG